MWRLVVLISAIMVIMSVRINAISLINRKYLKRLYQKVNFLYGGFSDDWYKK